MQHWLDIFVHCLNRHAEPDCTGVVNSKTHRKVRIRRDISKSDKEALGSARMDISQPSALNVDDVRPASSSRRVLA